MYFLKTLQIVLVVIAAGVQSGESRRSRLPTNICYSEVALMYEPLSLRYQHAIVDATGQHCYKTLSKRRLNRMFTKTLLDEAFANASAEVCSDWSNSKKCLFNHLNTKCNNTQVDRFQEDSFFNYALTLVELLCNPPENFNLLNFVKEATLDDGLEACTSTRDADREVAACMKRKISKKDVFVIHFHEMVRTFHQCYIQPIKNCSEGNTVKELHILGQLNQIEKAMFASYDAVWNQFKKPASPLQDLHNLLK